MVVYNFKSIKTVPEAKAFIDIMLSRVQRKTPTVVHKRYAVARIREFYMRKVKFAQQSFTEKLQLIIDDFPRLDTIHPFYADLINVLYDRDHYKLALGQLNVARNLIENIGKDYVKLLKFGDSLYRCKLLKRAALGRMCTVLKKQSASLSYLEQVRQHLSRLPSIDPKSRTLLITGYPNCGKSSFVNKVTRADVEVQPYAFTTKSLYVGHTDYKYMRWQVIDTPGILDHPLEERNTIEMQAVTALAHLQCCVLFFLDVSGQSNYSIQQQCSLFRTINPLFASKPLVIVCSKTDIRPLSGLDEEDRAAIDAIAAAANAPILELSNLTGDGVADVRNGACEQLLQRRVDEKIGSDKVKTILNRIHVAIPKPRDTKERPSFRPASLEPSSRPTRKVIEEENGGAGVYTMNDREHWDLDNADWKWDDIPEVFLGKNVADFYDEHIAERLDALEAEEAAMLEAAMDDVVEDDTEDAEHRAIADAIRAKKAVIQHQSRINKSQNTAPMPRHQRRDRSVVRFEADMAAKGLHGVSIRARSKTRKPLTGSKRGASAMDVDASTPRSASVAAAVARKRSQSCFRDESMAKSAEKLALKRQRLQARSARRGEGDRHIPTLRPKHLFSGKRGIGKTDWR